MGDWTLSLPWLTIKPRWRVRDHSFDARTPWLLRLLSLFAYDRHLHIDTNRRAVYLRVRRYWFSRNNIVVTFARIKSIVYGYSGLPVGTGQTAIGQEVTDRLDKFRVGLLLVDDPNPITLFTFRAEAVFLANFAAEWIDEGVLEISGDEEDVSREFVALLRKHLGVPARSLMHARVQDSLKGSMHPCPNCQRQIMKSAPRCVYCGAKFKHAG